VRKLARRRRQMVLAGGPLRSCNDTARKYVSTGAFKNRTSTIEQRVLTAAAWTNDEKERAGSQIRPQGSDPATLRAEP
jgi:hypothetical protein